MEVQIRGHNAYQTPLIRKRDTKNLRLPFILLKLANGGGKVQYENHVITQREEASMHQFYFYGSK